MAAALTLEALYALYTPVELPQELGEFADFITEEAIAPIGQEKPEGLADLPPYDPKSHQRRTGPRQSRGKGKSAKLVIGPRPKPVVTQVEVNPKYANVDFAAAWGKPKPKAEEAPKQDATSAPAPKAQASAWGKPATKPKSSFAALMEEESKETNTKVSYSQETATAKEIVGNRSKLDSEYPTLGGARKQPVKDVAKDPLDEEYPSLGGKRVVKKKNAWGFKP